MFLVEEAEISWRFLHLSRIFSERMSYLFLLSFRLYLMLRCIHKRVMNRRHLLKSWKHYNRNKLEKHSDNADICQVSLLVFLETLKTFLDPVGDLDFCYNLFSCCFYHCKGNLKISSKTVDNF